ncbi:iron-sulfur cluster-binding domain-containing protein [Flavobacterium daejeonense]|uniref:iron-sulfur cluster-binding domain-containing protein n=1 Tax=Flavobacterium daejeonense TaxID=350893 RepID=UPI00047BA00A|nr:iron-sulfur cluster-binding domain-containing protein [Flavobacterium daejeonense]
MNTYTLKVIEIKKETGNTVTLCFKQPGLKKIKYLAGQYLTLVFKINGRRYLRPYSFSSAPKVDSSLEVTIKRVPNGIVSNYINDEVKVGDVIEVLPPMGDFIYPIVSNIKNVFLWGVGSGVTPLFSLLKFILNEESLSDTQVHLIYGNHNIESSIFWDALHILQQKYSDRLQITHFHTCSQQKENTAISILGRIEPHQVLRNYESDKIKESLHYICGPSDLKNNIKTVLAKYDLPKENVLIEDFELVKNPKDFDGIETRKVILNFENKETELEVTKGKSILEAALDAAIELPYSCQTGNCSTCKGQLKGGKGKMIGIQERKDLLEDEYLLCCTYPLTNNVYIEI